MILDKVFAQVTGGLDKYMAENNVLKGVSDAIQLAQMVMDVRNSAMSGRPLDGVDQLLNLIDPKASNMFKGGATMYKSGMSFIGDGTAEGIAGNVKKHIAVVSKDRLNGYLMNNVKGYKMATESSRVLNQMQKKMPKVKTPSQALELVSDMVTLGDKMGLKASSVVNQELLSKSKAKIILLESGMERMRSNGVVLY